MSHNFPLGINKVHTTTTSITATTTNTNTTTINST